MLKKTLKYFVYISLIVMCAFTKVGFTQQLVTENKFEAIIENKASFLDRVEQEFSDKSKQISNDEIIRFIEELRIVKKNSLDKISTLEAEKQKQKELLNALGDAPDKEKGEEEAPEIQEKRKHLNEEIILIDGKIKENQLFIARSDDLLEAADHEKLQNLQSRFVQRIPSPFMPQAMISALSQGYELFEIIGNSSELIFLSSVLGFLIFLSFPISIFLKSIQENFKKITLDHVSIRLLSQFIISSIIILVLRFGNLGIEQFEELHHLLQAIGAILLTISLWELFRKIKFKNTTDTQSLSYVPPVWRSLKNKLQVIILLFIPLSIIGFTEVSAYFVFNIFTIFLAVVFFIGTRSLAIKGLFYLESLSASKNKLKQEDLYSSAPATLFIEPIIAILTLVFALFFWGLDLSDIQQWTDKYSNGIPIGKLTLNFDDLGAALFSFFVILSVFKVLKWFLSSRVFPKTTLDLGIVNAILTTLGYLGIILATVSASGALGIDASNLALVAGALSVGIGFGLQTIFSNFISGLILLFERPFKVGDWVSVGEFEGLIKKISVRSTEIETFQRSSVIVPNSQMISDIVTNRTLRNAMGRVEVVVGVAYGSDIEKVRALLLECVEKNNKILKYPKPDVLFINFGDSSLDFELRCFINDINNRLLISSELRFSINKAFQENNVEIPFPQRDIHIRSGLEKFNSLKDNDISQYL